MVLKNVHVKTGPSSKLRKSSFVISANKIIEIWVGVNCNRNILKFTNRCNTDNALRENALRLIVLASAEYVL